MTVTTADGQGADTYISNDSQSGQGPDTTHGTTAGFQHRRYDSVRMKLLYVRFDKGINLINYSGSTLSLNLTGANRTRTINVYGLKDGDAGELWPEATTSWHNAPGIFNPGIAQVDIDTNRLVLLGTWSWQNVPGVQTSDPATLNLAPFLQADTDGVVSFFFNLPGSDSAASYFGDTKETVGGVAPTLTMPNAVVDPGLSNLVWAVGSGTWDVGTTADWQDGVGGLDVYQEVNGIGNRVMLDDSASGSSPIEITLDTAVTPRSITNNSTKDYTITGAGSINGPTGITKGGSSTLTLSTFNSFTGPINLDGGVLSFSVGALGQTLASIQFNGGTLRYISGNTEDISTHPVTFGPEGATIDTGGNDVLLVGPIGNGGSGSFTKVGSGRLLLGGTNIYSGSTIISQGSLGFNADGNIPNTPIIDIAEGAVLDVTGIPAYQLTSSQMITGDGSVDGTLISTPGTKISPGSGVGRLTILNSIGNGQLQMNGGIIVADISAVTNDTLVVNGNLDLSSGSVQLNVTGTLTNGSYKFVTYSGSIVAGSAANLAVTGFTQDGQIAFLSDATPGEIDIVVANKGSDSLVWNGTVNNLWDVETTANWLKGGTPSEFLQGDVVTFDATGAAQPNVNLAGALFPSNVIVNASSDYTLSSTSGGKISGGAGLTKSGTGNLTILTDNNNSGSVLINSGAVQVGDGSQIGHLGNGSVVNNGTITYNNPSGADRIVGSMSGSGSLTQNGAGSLTVAGDASYTGATTIGSGAILRLGNGGAVTLQSSGVADDGTLVLNSSSDISYAHPISGSGGLTKAGSGTLTFGVHHTYADVTRVEGGKLILSGANFVPPDAITAKLQIETGGVVEMGGFDQGVGAFTSTLFAGGRLVNNLGTGTNTLTVSNTSDNDSSAIIADNDGSGGAIRLVKAGPATLILRADNSYSGGTIVQEGTLSLRANAAAGVGGITLNDGSTLSIGSSSSVFPDNNIFVPAGATANLVSGSLSSGMGGNFVSGDTSSILTLNTPLSWAASSTKQFQGFTGTVQIGIAGTLRFANTGLSVNGGDNTTFALEGILQTRNGTGSGPGISLGALSGSFLGIINGPQTPPGNSTYIIGAKGIDTTFSGTINGNVAGSANSIVKTGVGVLTLDGSLNYIGSTIVSNGVLAIAGSAELDDSPTIRVESGAFLDVSGIGGNLNLGNVVDQTLSGSGTLRGSVTASGSAIATIAPGFPIGTLTITNGLTLAANSQVVLELNRTNAGATNDMIIAPVIVTSGSTLTITNLGPDLITGDSFKLFPSAVSGFATVNLPIQNAAGTVTYQWQNHIGDDGSITVLQGASPVATNPTNITFQVSGGQVTLSWPEDHLGWRLQAQTNTLNTGLTTTWFDVAGSTTVTQMNMTINPANGAVFYRLANP
ncbi:MAG TPA: autotransporter-associated beta strand repeat-containing protein [Verrucomicrobiae bacterium]|nr:autotransporter-associated beta strand repeat-containing protein [Verrucomicrobiae bacterium]